MTEDNSDFNTLPASKGKKSKSFGAKPFPQDCKIQGFFTGLDVEIFDPISMFLLQNNGCFGNNSLNYRQKPFVQQEVKIQIMPRKEYERKLKLREKLNVEESSEALVSVNEEILNDPFPIRKSYILMPEEAMFLNKELGCLEVKNYEDDNLMSTEQLWKEFCELKHDFVECYVSYLYLRSKNWVVKTGIKFGGQFLLYKHGPQYFHASYIVKIATDRRSFFEHQTNERIGEVTKKTVLYLEVFPPENVDSTNYMQNLDKFQVKEAAVQRYDVKENLMN